MVLKVRRQKFKMFFNRNVIWNTNVAFSGNVPTIGEVAELETKI